MARLKLSPPWIIRVSEIEELFRDDDEVHVVYDNDTYEVKLYVDSAPKAAALEQLLPEQYIFGNVTLKVIIVPANDMKFGVPNFSNRDSLYRTAFSNNPAFDFVQTLQGIFANNLTYVVFANKVVQYWNDDLGDIFGQCSTLYQDIAKNVFGEQEGVFYCTNKSPINEDPF